MLHKSALGDNRLFMMMVLVAASTGVCSAQSADQKIFTGNSILDLTIQAPFKELGKQTGDSDQAVGQLELSDGTTIPMRCNKYGISRLRECRLASLKITVEADDVRNTPFEGHRTLRMVTPCKLGGDFDKYTVLEYLVYRSYILIAEPALRVQLVEVRFRDSKISSKEETGFAFFVEEIDSAAAARNQTWLDVESALPSQLDRKNLTTLTLFQYMIGNLDWSAVRGPKGERCCHNIALFGGPDGGVKQVLPFDFDQTGVVNPPYAAPSTSLGATRITSRVYRGFCWLNDYLPASIEVFNQKRPDLEALFNDGVLPYPKERQRAWKYLEDFYEVINNPKKLKNKIVDQCR